MKTLWDKERDYMRKQHNQNANEWIFLIAVHACVAGAVLAWGVSW